MAFPLATVLSAAPGIISAAADIIKLVRQRKHTEEPQQSADPRIEGLAAIIEKQAVVIEDLARNNSQLALEVRNNRIIAFVASGIALLAILVAILK